MLVCGVNCEEPFEVDTASPFEADEADDTTPHATGNVRDASGLLAKAGAPYPGGRQDRGKEPAEERGEEHSKACS